jgi:hypothetical protein
MANAILRDGNWILGPETSFSTSGIAIFRREFEFAAAETAIGPPRKDRSAWGPAAIRPRRPAATNPWQERHFGKNFGLVAGNHPILSKYFFDI